MRRTWLIAAVALAVGGLATASWCLAEEKPAQPPKPAQAAPKPPVTAKPDELEKVAAAMPDKPYAQPLKPRNLLVFTLCKGFRHSSIDLAAKTFELMGQKTGAWKTTITDDPAVAFAADNLKKFDAIMMDNCTGSLTDDATLKQNILDFVRGGKGLAGIHAATDVGGWKFPEFHEMIGGVFAGHPFRRISVKLDDPASPLNQMFEGKGFEISDEIYTFKGPYSREKLRILLSIDWDNSGITKGMNRDDNDYALSWIREYGQGRVFYCAFGHDHQIFWNPVILKHFLAGIQYAFGDLKADATPSAKVNLKPAPGPALGEKKSEGRRPVVTVYAAPAAEAGWITLFDGKDLSAWQEPAASKWKIVDGVLTWEKGCGNLWTKEKFGDFILDLEFKATNPVKGPDGKEISPGTNSGVFLRSPEGEKNWLHGSIEIQISNSYGPDRKPGKHDAGAVYDIAAPTVAAEKPVGEWNHMTITCKGNLLKVVLNEKQIIDINLDDWKEAGMNPDGTKNKFKTAYKDMAKVGHIGLQDHGQPVWYRNIRIKPLTTGN